MAFFKRISGGRGRRSLPRALPPSPPSGRLQHTASPGTASEGSSRRGDFTLFFRADARPAAAGTGTHPKKQATERSRRRPERARNARPLAADAARKKLDAPSAAARRRPGPAGCARPSWPSRGRPPRMRAPPAAVPPWPGRFQRLTRGASSGRPTRGRRGRATRRRTCGARPPEARAGATEPRTRLGGRHTARQQGSERSRAQNANSARARRPRSRKASRRVLGRRRRPRRENCVRKGGAVPFWRPIGLSHDFRRVNPNSP